MSRLIAALKTNFQDCESKRFVVRLARIDRARTDFGGHTGGVTPDPISNSEVKTSRADGTAGEALWESRSPPGTLERPGSEKDPGLSFLWPMVGRPAPLEVSPGGRHWPPRSSELRAQCPGPGGTAEGAAGGTWPFLICFSSAARASGVSGTGMAFSSATTLVPYALA